MELVPELCVSLCSSQTACCGSHVQSVRTNIVETFDWTALMIHPGQAVPLASLSL